MNPDTLRSLDGLWPYVEGEWIVERHRHSTKIWGPKDAASTHPNGRQFIGEIADEGDFHGGWTARFLVALHNAWPEIRKALK